MGVEKFPTCVMLDKPIYVGMSILDISKLLMYRFHYGHMLPKYGPERLSLLMTDTDSFIYQVETENIYTDMLTDLDLYDTSNYDPSSPLYSATNKKVLGKMKDEMPNRYIRLFVGLRSKVYTLVTKDEERIMRAKGVRRQAVQKYLTEAEYMAVIHAHAAIEVTQSRIRSRNHQMQTIQEDRLALCAVDDKRYVLDDNIRTLAHGHYSIAVKHALDDILDKIDDESASSSNDIPEGISSQ